MRQKKLVFIIPGFKHKPTHKAYQEVAKLLKKEGYTPVPITIPWKKRTITQNTQFFLQEYQKRLKKHSRTAVRKKTYLLGFSFGAMIAFLASTRVRVSGLILCSLSPFFKEDLPKTVKPKKKTTAAARYEDFSRLHYRKIAKSVKAKRVLMVYGSKETAPLIKRSLKTYRHVASPKKRLIAVRNSQHDIGDKNYLRTIRYIAQDLL